MKKYQILTVAFLISIIFNATPSYCQTTQEEYNYITKGYKTQVIDQGGDLKKGYAIKDLGDWGLTFGVEKRRCEFKAFIREGQTKPCAIMMVYKRTDVTTGANYYICIPSIDAPDDIWQQTLTFVNTTFKDNDAMLQTTIWSLMKFSAQEASK